jgi:peptide deformylase
MDNPLSNILRFGDPRLKQVCDTIMDGMIDDGEVEQLLRTLHAFRAHHGWGRAISACQVGIMKRMIAVHLDGKDHVLVNPEIIWKSHGMTEVWDDCMSMPEIAVRVRRHDSISLSYINLDGQPCAFERVDFDVSELLQHEMDHLDGIIMTDRMCAGSLVVAHENRHLLERA